jgi:DNA modification methylase
MSLPRNTVLVGDAVEVLRTLPSGSIDVAVTSPPYFQLRSYGVDRQYGLEPHIDAWVAHLQAVCRELQRVLVPTGSLWLNLGDSYSRHPRLGAPAKSLLLGPERLAVRLIADGWHLRNHIVWAKTNPMPASVRDRLACTWEHLYFFTKQPDYFFDLDSIRVPHRSRPPQPGRRARTYLPTDWAAPLSNDHGGLPAMKRAGRVGHPGGKNPGDVWSLATAAYRGAHFATFPTKLVERPIRAACPRRRCRRCRLATSHRLGRTALRGAGCSCGVGVEPGVVLDPFMGAGTVGVVAARERRDWIGIEINPTFAALARKRIATEQARIINNEKGGDHA